MANEFANASASAHRGAISDNAIDVGEHIDTAPLSGFHALVMILCALIMIMDGFDLTSMGMVVPTLSDDWGVSQASFSQDFFSPLSAVLFGVILGSISAGYLADRFGRKPVVLAMLVLAAAFMFLTTTATTVLELVSYRFFTGIGAGGSIPIAIAIASEFAPAKHRSLLVMAMYTGAPLGTSLGGIIGPELISSFGWEGIFHFGAISQMAIAVVVFFLLPESPKFLTTRPKRESALRNLLERVRSDRRMEAGSRFVLREEEEPRGSLGALFTPERIRLTLTLWLIFFGMQFVLFYVSLMMPAYLKAFGWSSTEALRPLGFYNLGAFFGGVGIGLLANRIGPARSLTFTLPLAAVLLVALGFSVSHSPFFFGLAFVAGAATIGNGMALAPLAANVYPTYARSTGVGAALSVGRGGSIIAPFIGAIGLNAALGVQGFFMVAAISPIVCFLGVLLLLFFSKDRPKT